MNRFFSFFLGAALVGMSSTAFRAQGEPLVKNGQTIAFLGDSITAYGWASPSGYVHLVVDGLAKEGITVTPIPAGVGGNTSKDMLQRLDGSVLEKKPDWMTLSCGVNDVWHGPTGVDLPAYKKNIAEIVDRAQAQGIKVIVFTSTPIYENDNPNNQKLVDYNEFLRQFARERSLPLADLNADFQGFLQKREPLSGASRNLTVDGVHMNSEGNAIMAKGCLRAMGVPPSEIEKIEQGWLAQPNTARFVGPDVRGVLDISLAQYRRMEQCAQSNHVEIPQVESTVWLQAMAEVIDSHASQPFLDGGKIQAETLALLPKKLDAFLKAQP
jgi:lysophospholipase L1-like esterase